jgi:hypothetical protein
MVKPQFQTKNDRSVTDPRRSGDTAASTVREIPAAATAATEAVQESAEAARDITVDAIRQWADGVVGLPVKVVAGGDVGPLLSGRAWLDGTFETVIALLTVQRRTVDRILESQHRIAARLVDSGWALTTAISGVGLGGRAGERETPNGE